MNLVLPINIWPIHRLLSCAPKAVHGLGWRLPLLEKGGTEGHFAVDLVRGAAFSFGYGLALFAPEGHAENVQFLQ